MTDRRKAFPRVGIGLGAVGALLIAAGLVLRAQVEPPAPVDLEPRAAEARARAMRTLDEEARALEPKAAGAAQTSELVAALKMGVDHETFQDLLDNEEWWAPYRKGFPLAGVVTAGDALTVPASGATDVVAGDAARLAAGAEQASGILRGRGRAFLAATARIKAAAREGHAPPSIVLGVPIDRTVLAKASTQAGDGVALFDGPKIVESTGSAEAARAWEELGRRTAPGAIRLSDGRAGSVFPLIGDLRLGVAFAPPPAPPPPAPSPLWLVLIAAGTSALLGAASVLVRWTSAPPVGTAARIPESRGGRGTPTPNDPTVAFGPRGSAETVPSSRPRIEQGGGTYLGPSGNSQYQMGRYRLIERIGEGGMAEIFFAAAHGAEDFVRYFVVKRMHPHVARNRVAVNQFIDEAQLQALLVHSNIVPVFDFGKVGDEYFLALEYIHGKDLRQVVARHMEAFGRPLDLRTAFFILHGILEGLAFAHNHKERSGRPLDVVHRDVAPGNVLVSYEGEVKLTDFGIAKADKRVSSTEIGTVKGNAAFMSPEQARGESVDRRSDLFSAGAVLHHCLTGQLLYEGESTLDRLLRAAVGPLKAQFGQIDQLPSRAGRVLRRALANDTANRYQSAAEFARDVAEDMADRSEMMSLMDSLFPVTERRDLR